MKTRLLAQRKSRTPMAERAEAADQTQTTRSQPLQTKADGDNAPSLPLQLERANTLGHSLAQFTVQPALVMGEPGDKYEQEADAIASQAVQRQPQEDEAPTLQREPADLSAAGDTAAIETAAPEPMTEMASAPDVADLASELDTGEDMSADGMTDALTDTMDVDTDAIAEGGLGDLADAETEVPEPTDLAGDLDAGSEGVAPNSIEGQIQAAMASGGESLPDDTQSWLRRSLGMVNPEAIVIHDDSEAHDLCDQLAALAFTTGNHIFFAAGEYDPDSDAGRELLAHEAVHTMQQGAIEGGAETEADLDAGATDAEEAEVTNDLLGELGIDDSASAEDADIDHVAVQAQQLQRAEWDDDETDGQTADGASTTDAESAADGSDLGGHDEAVASEETALDAIDPAAEVNKPVLPTRLPEPVEMPDVGEAVDRQDVGAIDAIGDGSLNESLEILTEFSLLGSLENAGLEESFFNEVAADSLLVQRETEESAGFVESMTVEDTEPYPDWAKVEGDDFGTQLAQTLVVGQTAGAVYDVYDTFASISDETNGFGVAAAILEGFCKILQVITNILDLIGLTLSIISLVLLIAAGILAIGLPWTAGAVATLLSWAANIMNAAIQIDKIVLVLILWRMLFRALSIGLRIASVFYEGGNWDDAWNAVQSQVMAFGLDAARAALAAFSYGGVNPTAGGGFINTAATSTSSIALSTAGKAAYWGVFFGGIATIKTESFAGGVDDLTGTSSEETVASDDSEAVAQAKEDSAMMAQLEERQEDLEDAQDEADDSETDADLPEIPEDAPFEVSDAAANTAYLAMGEGYLTIREIELMDIIASRQLQAERMHAYQTGLASHQASVQGAEDVFGAHNQLNEAAIEQGAPAGEESAAGAGPMNDMGSDLKGQQGMIKSGGKMGESQGADAAATQAGPSAQQDADQGPKSAEQSGQGAVKGEQEAAGNIKDNEKKIGEAEALKQDTANTQDDLDKAQIYNSAELERLFAELANVQAAADVATAAREEEEDRRADAIAELFDWTQDHQEAVEAFFLDDAEDDEDFEVEDDDDDAADDDTEEEDSSDLLAAFYEWLSEATEPMRDDVEAEEENDIALYA
ncbi:MAG: DUF4157 domain-containing protein [Leptolyngbya sp. SIOISBB]|nr:DUF4157 domain-containing protein [Leptolyngbya sp. SIOISBB]